MCINHLQRKFKNKAQKTKRISPWHLVSKVSRRYVWFHYVLLLPGIAGFLKSHENALQPLVVAYSHGILSTQLSQEAVVRHDDVTHGFKRHQKSDMKSFFFFFVEALFLNYPCKRFDFESRGFPESGPAIFTESLL